MNSTLVKLNSIGIIPVVKIDDAEKAVPLAKALMDGGLPCAEITFRTAEAEQAIKNITSALPEILVGAGTVLTTEQVDRAVAAGAKFIVSPGFNPEVVKHCIDKNIPITPGCSNPTDIEMAISMGLEVVKFFPAEAMGGIKTIKALSAPYSNVKFIPTGGVNEKNLNDYLSCPSVLACGGSWMVSGALINSGDFDKITELTKNAVKTMLGLELAHVGINTENEEEALSIAGLFSSLLGVENKVGNSSIFAGKSIEVIKSQGRGKHGHIAIGTNSIDRAIEYFESLGFTMDSDNTIKDDSGNIKAIYLEKEIGGFAVHLVQK